MKGKYFCLITAFVLLTLSGCGDSGVDVSEEQSSTASEKNEQTISEGEGLKIEISELSETVSFYPLVVDGTEMEVIACKDSDGNIRTAFNTCQVCYSLGKGYYVQEGDYLVCQNCGNSFTADQIGEESGGCNPYPITDSDRAVSDETVTIFYSFLKEQAEIFSNWKA